MTLAFCLASHGCGAQPGDPPDRAAGREVASGVLEIGRIANPRISESSGIVASRQHPGVFWTHNDGGGPKRQTLYAIRRQGGSVAQFLVTGSWLEDWEDIAIDDEGRLYLGDIGNNDAKRDQLAVYEIDEPDPKTPRGTVTINRGWPLRFPKKPFDCEALFVWQGHGYVISKVFKDKRAEIYRFPLTGPQAPHVLEWVARLPIESPVTGADLSSDGRRLGVVCKAGAFVFRLNGDLAGAGKARFHRVRLRDEHIEGCCFVPQGMLATAESREIYLFTDEAFRPAP
jgi:hypothetical protein